MMIRCSVCGDRHRVPDHYDNKDFICMNTSNRVSQRVYNNLTPENILSSNNLMNRRSTKVDEARPTTVIINGPSYRRDGSKIGTLPKPNY